MQVRTFLNTFNIKPGDKRFEQRHLHFIYQEYSKSRPKFDVWVELIDLPKSGIYFLINQESVDKLDKLFYNYSQEYFKKKASCLNRYIEYYNLQPGNVPVEASLLHELYKRFNAVRKNNLPIEYEDFLNLLNPLFDNIDTAGGRLYYLNENIHVAVKLENEKAKKKLQES